MNLFFCRTHLFMQTSQNKHAHTLQWLDEIVCKKCVKRGKEKLLWKIIQRHNSCVSLYEWKKERKKKSSEFYVQHHSKILLLHIYSISTVCTHTTTEIILDLKKLVDCNLVCLSWVNVVFCYFPPAVFSLNSTV